MGFKPPDYISIYSIKGVYIFIFANKNIIFNNHHIELALGGNILTLPQCFSPIGIKCIYKSIKTFQVDSILLKNQRSSAEKFLFPFL